MPNGKITDNHGIVLGPDGGKSLWVLGDLYTFKVTGEETGESLAIIQVQVQPQNGPPPHIHHREDETFYVLEGEFSFLNGDKTFSATAGSCVHIPQRYASYVQKFGSFARQISGYYYTSRFREIF